MPGESNVDAWLERETDHKRKALENASRYFDENDNLTVNTLEALYGQESSFGTMLGERGTDDAAGHFMLKKATAEEYGLVVTKENDQRFDIDYASSAAARYLKDLNTMFGKKTILLRGLDTIPVKDMSERKKFVLVSYNGGQGRIARAQSHAEKIGKNPQLWNRVPLHRRALGYNRRSSCIYMRLGNNMKKIFVVLCFILFCSFVSDCHAESPDEIFGNMTYTIGNEHAADRVTLTGGKCEVPRYLYVYYEDQYVYGDFNNDGLRDAAVIIAESGGGSGHFRELAFLINDGAKFVHEASCYLGDRVIIESLKEQKGKVVIEMLIRDESMWAEGVMKRVKNTYEYSGSQAWGEGMDLSDKDIQISFYRG